MSLRQHLKLPAIEVSDPDYYVLLESHLPFLRDHPSNGILEVDGQIGAKYRGDFQGLLDYLGIDRSMHYLIMRLNGLSRGQDYNGELLTIVRPDTSVVAGFVSTFASTQD